MAYEVTATRRRPQKFDDLAGQNFVAETLKNSLKSGKIAHAYLFSGPRGCGKTSTARILAKALNCEKANDGDFSAGPCGECEHCKEITRDASLDVIEIDGASNTSVNDVRQIKDEVMFPPNSSRYKIYIIDEVHMLSNQAFNALLKTIEEPPPYVVFIFATTELHKVPATIKSRCQQFNFRLVAIEKIKDLLAGVAKEIGITADEEALFWIARESTGSVRDAYTLFDQVASFSDDHITYEKIRDSLGLVGINSLNEIFETCVDKDVSKCTEILAKFLQDGVSIDRFISDTADYVRSLLLIKNGVKKESLLLGRSVDLYSAKVLNAWSAIQAERALSIFVDLYRDIRYSLSPRYELELAFEKLCWLSEYVSSAEVKKAIDAASSLLANGSGKSQTASQNFVQNTNTQNFTNHTNSKTSVQSYAPSTVQNSVSSNSNFSASENSNVPQSVSKVVRDLHGEELKEAIKESLSNDKEPDMISHLISATTEWQETGDTIKTTVSSKYQFDTLLPKSHFIEEKIFELTGRKVKFEVVLNIVAEETAPHELPRSVEIVCDTFKGTVM